MEARSSAGGEVGESLRASSTTGTVHFQELFFHFIFRNHCAFNTSVVFLTNVQKAAGAVFTPHRSAWRGRSAEELHQSLMHSQ